MTAQHERNPRLRGMAGSLAELACRLTDHGCFGAVAARDGGLRERFALWWHGHVCSLAARSTPRTATATAMLVTPAGAAAWLRRVPAGEREPCQPIVHQYARAMAAGEWQCLPDRPIEFDAEGRLRNGQHRLMAIVLANMPVRLVVRQERR